MTAETASPEAAHRGLVTLAVMLATIMQALDTTIANVALPHMQGTMGATQDQISWVLTSYIVAAAIFMPLTGFLAARLGRKRVFMWSVVGFTVASMLCGAAQNLGQIVVFRLLQGIFGASLVPLSQAVLLDAYPRERHGSAMALWGVGVMVGPILGPSLGGWLTEYYNWRWVFYINMPFGLLAWLGLAAFVHETPIDLLRRFDLPGFALLSIGIGSLQMMLDRGESLDWFTNPEVAIEAMLAGLAVYLFIAHIFTHTHPFIEPAIFKDRNFSVGLLFIFIIGVILLATMALLPPFMQNLMGYPVIDVGLPAGAARRRHHDRHDYGGQAFRQAGPALHDFSWPHPDQPVPVANDPVQYEYCRLGHCEHRRHTRVGVRIHFCAAVHDHLLHIGTALPQRGHGTVQPDAQPRKQHWHLGGDNLSGATHSDQPRRLCRLHQPFQFGAENGG